MSPDGKSAYVTDFVGDTVSQYNIGTDGALHPKTHATVATGHNPLGIAVSPDSQSVYVADRADGLIAEYAVSANGLVLKFPETRPAGLNPTELVVAPDGKHVYGIDRGGEALLEYSGGDGPGPLTPLNPLSLPFNPPADLPGIAIGPPQIQFSCGGVLEFCRIRLVPLTSTGGTTTAVTFTGTVVRTAPLGILVQRIVGKRHVLVGHVPFGLHKTGRLRIRWNLRVNGHKLSQGRYLITLRMFDVEGHLIALAHPGKVTVK